MTNIPCINPYYFLAQLCLTLIRDTEDTNIENNRLNVILSFDEDKFERLLRAQLN